MTTQAAVRGLWEPEVSRKYKELDIRNVPGRLQVRGFLHGKYGENISPRFLEDLEMRLYIYNVWGVIYLYSGMGSDVDSRGLWFSSCKIADILHFHLFTSLSFGIECT